MSAGVPDEVAAAALHGSYCPKMCSFACPVHAATGREDAVPWTFHRTVSDLASGRLAPEDARDRLVACTGCLACRQPCTFEQDVPEQVRAGRAVARPRTPDADAALARMSRGVRPDESRPPEAVVGSGELVLVPGHETDQAEVAAARRLFAAAGVDATVVVPAGCCSQLADDLGDAATGDDRRAVLADLLADAPTLVGMDPHCLPSLRRAAPDAEVLDLASALAARIDDVAFRPDGGPVTYQDPCVLARGEGVVDPPRRLLAAAGYELVEPEYHGAQVACAGAGMGLPLLDPDAAGATAARRAAQLAATGAPTVTACARSAAQLAAAGRPSTGLAAALVDRLPEEGSA